MMNGTGVTSGLGPTTVLLRLNELDPRPACSMGAHTHSWKNVGKMVKGPHTDPETLAVTGIGELANRASTPARVRAFDERLLQPE